MTIEVRRDAEIYDVEGGWYRARWHFSFDRYYDPANTQFGTLRVFNDDRLIPGAIWPLHPHRDIEGLTYVVEGSFRHEDNVGGAPGPLPAGSVQRMTLGSGAWHSEQNASETEPMRFIQMWIVPAQRGLRPGVEQKVFTKEERSGKLLKAISGDRTQAGHGDSGDSVLVHQDAAVYISHLDPGDRVEHEFEPGKGAYLYLIEGAARLNDQEKLSTGDAAKIYDERHLVVEAEESSELIMVEVRLD